MGIIGYLIFLILNVISILLILVWIYIMYLLPKKSTQVIYPVADYSQIPNRYQNVLHYSLQI